MRAFLSLVAIVVVVALGVAAYLAKGHYERLTAELGTCKEERASQRSKLSTQSADLARAREAEKTHDVTRKELDSLRAQRDAIERQKAAFNSLRDKLQGMIATGKLKVMFRKGRMILKLPAEILFASGDATLSKQGQAALGEVATVLKDFSDRSFMIAGHTDDQPVKDSPYRNNWELSTQRALTVTEFLIASGVNPENLVAAGYGEFDAIAPNNNAGGRRDNRRIELVLLPNVEELPRLMTAIDGVETP